MIDSDKYYNSKHFGWLALVQVLVLVLVVAGVEMGFLFSDSFLVF